MEIIYRAKDGTEFDNHCECEQYELTLAFKDSNYKLLNAKMQPTVAPEEVRYAKFNSYEDIKAFNQICDEHCSGGVECYIDETKPLVFHYDTTNDCYIQYGVRVEELENELSSLKSQYEKLLSI